MQTILPVAAPLPRARLALALLLLAGCGGAKIQIDDSGPGIDDTDTTDTDTTVADGSLSASPGSLDFGLVFVGQSSALVVTVQNVGTGDVALAADATSGAGFAVVTPDSPGPGESVDLTVTFTPVGFGDATGTLTITDTLGDSSISIPLSGTAQVDEDGDGYGSLASGGDDCDDASDVAHPGANEVWYDGIDEACDGGDDYDRDGDGTTYDTDCDDGNAAAYPGATEVWYDGIDEDCAGGDDYDQDGDTYQIGSDCDDTDATANPAATDTWYDGVDSDCDGADDYDQDADGETVDTDCDDTDASIYTGAAETWYDGVDSDCGGGSDYDQDADGVDWPTDCNDTDATVTGPTTEVLDGVDNDCDGYTDELSVDETAAGILYGGTSNLGLGDAGSMALGGDLDADGIDDVLVLSDNSGSGYAWGVSGPDAAAADGYVDSYDFVAITGSSSYYPLTQVVGPLRDVTGDGTDDVLVAGASTSGSYYSYGYAWLERGGSTLTGSISTYYTYTARFSGDSEYDRLRQLASGDLDGDGDDDVVSGCPSDNYSSGSSWYSDSATGNVGVFEAGTFNSAYDLDDTVDQIHGSNEYDYLGYTLAVADLDDDGYADIVAGAYGLDDGASNGGGVYVFSGNATLAWDARADDAATARILGGTSSAYLGSYAMAAPGDVDGDGSLDLVLSSAGAGEAWLFWSAGALTGDTSTSSADVTMSASSISFGTSVATASDLDGDGADEIYVGASGDDTAGTDAGAVYRFQPASGSSGTLGLTDATASYVGAAAGDALGAGLAAGGDADGDGREDLLIGATGDDGGTSNGGAVYVILGD